MIPRYTPHVFDRIWSSQSKYQAWLRVELAFCAVMEGVGPFPAGVTSRLMDAVPDVLDEDRISDIERETKHDLLAFLSYLEEVGGDDARWIHFGLTSSDVVDTAFSLLLREAGEAILRLAGDLVRALIDKAREHARTPMIGRTHGMHAEALTFGLVLASHLSEVHRCRERVKVAVHDISVGKMSGAVGTHWHVSPAIESAVMSDLGLRPDVASLQVVSRDRHAAYFQSMALMASALERLAVNVRHWQRSEVGEASEPFSSGQKGSSAMPHKRNPVTAEKICGLSRIVRALAASSLENVPLWHERDISHSSSERVIAPDVTSALGHMLVEAERVVSGLEVDKLRMLKNIGSSGSLVECEAVMLELVRRGLSRRKAHTAVQRASFKSPGDDFAAVLSIDPDVSPVMDEDSIHAVLASGNGYIDRCQKTVNLAISECSPQ